MLTCEELLTSRHKELMHDMIRPAPPQHPTATNSLIVRVSDHGCRKASARIHFLLITVHVNMAHPKTRLLDADQLLLLEPVL